MLLYVMRCDAMVRGFQVESDIRKVNLLHPHPYTYPSPYPESRRPVSVCSVVGGPSGNTTHRTHRGCTFFLLLFFFLCWRKLGLHARAHTITSLPSWAGVSRRRISQPQWYPPCTWTILASHVITLSSQSSAVVMVTKIGEARTVVHFEQKASARWVRHVVVPQIWMVWCLCVCFLQASFFGPCNLHFPLAGRRLAFASSIFV